MDSSNFAKNVIVWANPDSPLHKVPLVKELKRNPYRYEQTSWSRSFPLLTDTDVQRSFGRKGTMFGKDIQQILFFDKQEKKLIGAVYFPPDCEGPPNRVHGGCLATALDGIFGWHSVRVLGLGCVTLYLNVTYRNFVPLRGIVRVEIETDRIEGRKLYMKGRLTNNVYSIESSKDHPEIIHNEAEALFIQHKDSNMTYEEASRLFGPTSQLSKEVVIEQFKRLKKQPKEQEQQQEHCGDTKFDLPLQSKL